MLTKNIKFENFSGKKNIKLEKTFKKSLNYAELLKNYPLLNSLTKQYKYSYQKKEIKSLKKYSNINLVGMGGSTLGAEAIYDFLKHKVKKKFFFF